MLRKTGTTAERTCWLAEEIGYHYYKPARVLRYDTVEDWRAEARARKWAHDRLLSRDVILTATRNTDDIYEMADALGVSVSPRGHGRVHGTRVVGDMRQKKGNKMKQIIAILLCCIVLCGCAAPANQASKAEEPKSPPDLTGEWKQINSSADDSYQSATITDSVIEIYWISEADDTKALYWSGTFVKPETADEPYSWDSANDKEKTDMALLASLDETKTFTYADGVISYEVSMMGVTQTVKLEKQ